MRRILTKAGVLAAVFVVCLLVFHQLFGGDDQALALQMEEPAFPTISFRLGNYEFNTLHGYAQPMDVPSVRETITPTDGRHAIDLMVTPYGNTISAIDYEVTSLSGKTVFESGTVRLTKVSGGKFSGSVQFDDSWKDEKEAVLQLKLGRGSHDPLYFYTRVTLGERLNAENNMDFALHFRDLTLDPEKEEIVEAYLEPDYTADNSTLYHVGMANDVSQVMWGDLQVESVSDPTFEIQECNPVYTTVILRYDMRAGDGEQTETYDVKEYYRVRPGNLHFYVLSFERTMELRYETKAEFLGKNGLDLGMTDPQLNWEADESGSFISYLVSDSIWQYDVQSNLVTKVFSFRREKNSDCRDTYDAHELRILHQGEDGNMSFLVSGYMNSGAHEGQVGIGIYAYDAESRTASLKTFLPSTLGGKVTTKLVPELTYYSTAQQKAFLLVSGDLYEYDAQKDLFQVIEEGVGDRTHAVSDDSRYIAYPEHPENPSSVTVFDLETGEAWYVSAPVGEEIRLWGFIDRDLVYSISRPQDAGKDILGRELTPSYELKIMDPTQTVQTSYSQEDLLIDQAVCANGLVTMKLVSLEQEIYKAAGADYIASSDTTEGDIVTEEVYMEQTRQQQVRLVIDRTLREQQPRRVAADLYQTRQEDEIPLPASENSYYVFTYGGVQGAYDNPGEAITAADENFGTCTAANGAYLWERGNSEENWLIEGIRPLAASTKKYETQKKAEGEITDTDGDGIPDDEDLDADGDGYTDDMDMDNVPDIYDNDKDGNGVDDIDELVIIPDTVGPIIDKKVSTTATCIQMLFNYYGMGGFAGTDPETGPGIAEAMEQVVSEYERASFMDLTDTMPEELCYVLNQNIPVMAVLDKTHAILMIGYDSYGIRFIDPTNGQEGYMTFEETQTACQPAGSHFLAVRVDRAEDAAEETEAEETVEN